MIMKLKPTINIFYRVTKPHLHFTDNLSLV